MKPALSVARIVAVALVTTALWGVTTKTVSAQGVPQQLQALQTQVNSLANQLTNVTNQLTNITTTLNAAPTSIATALVNKPASFLADCSVQNVGTTPGVMVR